MIDQWHEPTKNEDAAGSTFNVIYKSGQILRYIFHTYLTYQQVSDVIHEMDPVFDRHMKTGQPIADRLQNIAQNKLTTKRDDGVGEK